MQATAAHAIATRADLDAYIAEMNRRTDPSVHAAQSELIAFVRTTSARPEIKVLEEDEATRAIARAWHRSATNHT